MSKQKRVNPSIEVIETDEGWMLVAFGKTADELADQVEDSRNYIGGKVLYNQLVKLKQAS